MHIAIVDDDPDILESLKIVLEANDYVVVTAESGEDGLRVYKEHHPDLLIVDLMMENADSGFILSRKIKNMYPETPVILATAVTSETGMVFGLEEDEERRWIKADRYLEKGIRPEQLKAEINSLLNA